MPGLARETAYWKSRDPDFGAAWEEAMERGLDALEDEVMRRAKDGVTESVFCQGRVVGEGRRYSDVLAMFVLKSKRRDIWGEKQQLDLRNEIALMTLKEREMKALALLDMMDEWLARRERDLTPSVLEYDPGEPGDLNPEERPQGRIGRGSPVRHFAPRPNSPRSTRGHCEKRVEAMENDLLEIADDTARDYREGKNGQEIPNKEVVLRSKIRTESRQWLMPRRDPTQWDEKSSVDVWRTSCCCRRRSGCRKRSSYST